MGIYYQIRIQEGIALEDKYLSRCMVNLFIDFGS